MSEIKRGDRVKGKTPGRYAKEFEGEVAYVGADKWVDVKLDDGRVIVIRLGVLSPA